MYKIALETEDLNIIRHDVLSVITGAYEHKKLNEKEFI
jgi:hypothetical protein